MDEPKLLHKNITINSNKQKSAQGQVFYVKIQEEKGEEAKQLESILKIVCSLKISNINLQYPKEEGETFEKEKRILQ